MSGDNDRELVQQVLAGNERAFEMLVDKYEKVVFNVAYRMTSDHDASEDIAQAVFVKAFENLPGYDPRYKLFSWLYRMTINEALNYLKVQRRTEELSPMLPSSAKSPDESCREREMHEKIQDALMSLDADSRSLIVMRHYGDCSYKEMAEILGIPEKRVKSRLFTARTLLRDILVRRGILGHDS
jgi:RNA polymerase sigma-70 factor (ECF subfamily)